MSNTLETIIREIKKITEKLLKPYKNPIDNILIVCKRLIVLKELARVDIAVQEINNALQSISQYIEAVKDLIAEVSNKISRQ